MHVAFGRDGDADSSELMKLLRQARHELLRVVDEINAVDDDKEWHSGSKLCHQPRQNLGDVLYIYLNEPILFALPCAINLHEE